MKNTKTDKKKGKKKEKMLTYKGRPLVRTQDTIYYGDMADPYVAMLQVQESSDFKDLQMPQRVSVQIVSTDMNLGARERIKKRTEKADLYKAIQIAEIWLDRMLNPTQ